MWILCLVLVLCFSPLTNAKAGLLEKTSKNAVLHIPFNDMSVTWEFNLKNWGTWNILGVSINKEPLSAPSGTDWEYVYFAKPTDGTSVEWMGGNHDNERLKTLEFIVDGEVITEGRFKIENSLIINETTDLIYPVDKRVVGSVIRRYEIDLNNPNRIDFSQETTWHYDMEVDRAYICMLPIYKKHGRHLDMDGYKDSFPEYGRTDLRKGLQPVTETFMYGDHGLGMIIGIDSLESVDFYRYSLGGAFVWDLAADHVKLYYPRVVNTGLRSIPKGTVWSSKSYYIVVTLNDK